MKGEKEEGVEKREERWEEKRKERVREWRLRECKEVGEKKEITKRGEVGIFGRKKGEGEGEIEENGVLGI